MKFLDEGPFASKSKMEEKEEGDSLTGVCCTFALRANSFSQQSLQPLKCLCVVTLPGLA